LDRTLEILVPLSNDRIERLGTKTERFVRSGPVVLNRTPASVVPGYIQDGAKKVISYLVSPFKSSLFQT
jgi:hypothetical protein